jgi:hypothetical protein
MTSYGLDDPGSIPNRGKDFLSSYISTLALGLTQTQIECVPGAPSLGVKQQGQEADHSPPSVEVKNGGATVGCHQMSLITIYCHNVVCHDASLITIYCHNVVCHHASLITMYCHNVVCHQASLVTILSLRSCSAHLRNRFHFLG